MTKFIILIPLFNDWKSVGKLLNEIDLQVAKWDVAASVIIVNDASTEERFGLEFNFKKIQSVKILNMKKNRVHQRCIASGFKYICKNEDFDRVIVMDADGEDRPEEINDFIRKSKENPNMTITGNRFKRSEGIIFKIFYQIHKTITFIFTGKLVKFGNFTCLPKKHVLQLVEKSYLWNTYSSSILRTINDRLSIPSIRGKRYVLPSKMNFFGLFFHSLTIISVFGKQVIIRSIIFSILYLFFIFNKISIFTIFPLFCLLVFVLVIFKISLRSNMKEFNLSLENIDSIDTLDSSNSR